MHCRFDEAEARFQDVDTTQQEETANTFSSVRPPLKVLPEKGKKERQVPKEPQ